MALELIVNLLLIAGGIFCFVNVSTTMPHSATSAFWVSCSDWRFATVQQPSSL